ncbi:MAG TPA: histidinol dehydrogenase [Thermoleophilaceae bacterium]|nr:histidinol dehydrogenase [Thermoleophilaceae bacterium]
MKLRVTRFGADADAAQLRALVPPPRAVEDDVRRIVDAVRAEGDAAVLRLTAQFDHAEVAPDELRVPVAEIDEAIALLEPEVLGGLRKAIENVRAVAQAQLREPVAVALDDGQQVEVAELPVRRAAAYVPGGRAPYPSTVVMCAVTARAAGVDELAVCAPPGPGGSAHPTILAACGLCGVNEVYRMGGAQAIAALAYGTESVPAVDVIVGPGNAFVTEAKRQVAGVVGIDGLAGPSELVVVATGDADPDLIALDLLAQSEHGPDSLLALISADAAILDRVEETIAQLASELATATEAPLALVHAIDVRAAVRLADAIAPEHLQLTGTDPERCIDLVRSAGCLFVGRYAGTAFGDYVAGSNHVLPTGGAARFASGLSVATFRRRMARVSFSEEAARALAPHGAALARAEGFPIHGESMERRA